MNFLSGHSGSHTFPHSPPSPPTTQPTSHLFQLHHFLLLSKRNSLIRFLMQCKLNVSQFDIQYHKKYLYLFLLKSTPWTFKLKQNKVKPKQSALIIRTPMWFTFYSSSSYTTSLLPPSLHIYLQLWKWKEINRFISPFRPHSFRIQASQTQITQYFSMKSIGNILQ